MLLIWVSCYDKISIFLTYLIEHVCLLVSLLILLFLPQRLLWYPIACFLILHGSIKLLVLFNNWLLRNQTFVLQLTRSISLCLLLQMHIRLSLNTLYVIFGVYFLLAYISLVTPHLFYMVLWMLTGLVVLMIVSLWVDILSFLVIHWFLGHPVNNARSLVILLRLSIKPWPTVLLKLSLVFIVRSANYSYFYVYALVWQLGCCLFICESYISCSY